MEFKKEIKQIFQLFVRTLEFKKWIFYIPSGSAVPSNTWVSNSHRQGV